MATESFAKPFLFVQGFVQAKIANWSGSVLDSLYRHYYVSAHYEELMRLRSQTQVVQQLNANLFESQLEIEHLQQMLGRLPNTTHKQPIFARVIGRNSEPMAQTILIDLGTRDHAVKVGDAVLSDEGAVGLILQAGSNSSQVLLISDARSAVDVQDMHNRAFGIARGASDSLTHTIWVKDFDSLHIVRVGDWLVTSGISGAFPKGILLGEVVQISPSKDRVYLQAKVKPFVDFARIERVFVLVEKP